MFSRLLLAALKCALKTGISLPNKGEASGFVYNELTKLLTHTVGQLKCTFSRTYNMQNISKNEAVATCSKYTGSHFRMK